MAASYWEDNRITPLELAGIVICLVFATGGVTLPMFTSMVAQHDGWLAAPVGAIPGALVLAVVLYLDRRFPGEAFPDYSRRLLGSGLSKGVLILYEVY
ncbi:MAG: spore germination protein, partial [Limnochordales bacterium]